LFKIVLIFIPTALAPEAKAQQQQEQGAQEAALNVSQIIKNTGMDGTNV
jgi:hypothetical protein